MLQLRGLGRGTRITVLRHNDFGKSESVTLFNSKKKKKKELKGLGSIQKILRRTAKAEKNAISDYLKCHDKSRKKNRSGWLRDAATNVIRARRKGFKKLYA
jgi:hypothetical protein